MNMFFMPNAMWFIFGNSFKSNLNILGVSDAKKVMKDAKVRYITIIHSIPPFGENDILLVNILSAAMVAAVYLSLPEKVAVNQVEEFYRRSMGNNLAMKLALKNVKNFSTKGQHKLAKDADKSQRATNPYTWRYKFTAGKTIDSFDAIFDKCGICELFKQLNISEITPALCAYDYEMAKYTNSVFTREYTLASGGAVCDCHYKFKS